MFGRGRDITFILDNLDSKANILWLEVYQSLLDKIEDCDGVDHPGHDKNNKDESESDGSSMICAFMRDDETPDYLVPHRNIVEKFCYGASLHMLQSEQAPFLFKYGAWLGESGGGSFQSSPTWLTARGLYEALKPSVMFTISRRSYAQLD